MFNILDLWKNKQRIFFFLSDIIFPIRWNSGRCVAQSDTPGVPVSEAGLLCVMCGRSAMCDVWLTNDLLQQNSVIPAS